MRLHTLLSQAPAATDRVRLHAHGLFILIATSDNESQQQATDYASTHNLPEHVLRNAA
ncbi:hypothetical protein [Pseudomonas sp. 31 R 17]|nr:hypothetical protein [Pseudomonas sp. 31 R 17]